MVRPRPIDLNGVILGMQGMLKRLAGEDTALETKLDDLLGPVKMDPIQVDRRPGPRERAALAVSPIVPPTWPSPTFPA